MLLKRVLIALILPLLALAALDCVAEEMSNWPITHANNFTPQELEPFWNAEYKKILHAIAGDDLQAYFGFIPSLVIIKTPKLDAFVTEKGELYFSSGLLRLIRSDSELAFIVSHEMGHVLLGHHKSPRSQLHLTNTGIQEGSYLHQEVGADSFASDMLFEAGYDVDSGIHFMERIAQRQESLSAEGLLPAGSIQIDTRLNYLRSYLKNPEREHSQPENASPYFSGKQTFAFAYFY